MRVRISYGIDLAGAPAKTAELVEEAIKLLNLRLAALESGKFLLEDERMISAAPEWLDKIRQDMASADQVLADAHAIVSGYISVKNQPEQPEQAAPAPQPVPPKPESGEEAADVHEG